MEITLEKEIRWGVKFECLNDGDIFTLSLDAYMKTSEVSNDYNTYNIVNLRTGELTFIEDEKLVQRYLKDKCKLLLED